jgi:hypothetical protein
VNVSPLLYFAFRHGRQIATLVGGGDNTQAHKFLELGKTVQPWLKKYYPWLNDDNLLDDAIAALESSLTDPVTHWTGYPDPTQQ